MYDKTSMTSQHGNLLLRYCTECQSAFSKFKLFMDLEGRVVRYNKTNMTSLWGGQHDGLPLGEHCHQHCDNSHSGTMLTIMLATQQRCHICILSPGDSMQYSDQFPQSTQQNLHCPELIVFVAGHPCL